VFFRRKTTPSAISWQLVESFRNEEGQPRQRIVACLGDAALPAEKERKLIAKVLERKLRHPDLFSGKRDMAPLSETAASWVDRIYRGIVRDARYCQVQVVSDTDDLSPASSRASRPGAGATSAPVLEGVLVDGIEHEHSALLCRSEGRQRKEEAMFSKAEQRFLKDAQKLDLRLKNRRLAKPKKINQAIGRLKAKHPRVQRYYEIELRTESNPADGLVFEPEERELRQHRDLSGCYVLRTDRQDLAPEELWSVYISLTQAEEGFRALKTDLGLRPNFHQKEDRVDGHIFITVIAFHIWKWIRQKLDCANDTRDWVTVRRLLRTHCYATLIVPCEDGGVHHLRKPGRPEAQQRELYKLFGINTSNLVKTRVKFGGTGAKQSSIL
jgi:hypothetical protein